MQQIRPTSRSISLIQLLEVKKCAFPWNAKIYQTVHSSQINPNQNLIPHCVKNHSELGLNSTHGRHSILPPCVCVPPVHILKAFINFRETWQERFVAGAFYNSLKVLNSYNHEKKNMAYARKGEWINVLKMFTRIFTCLSFSPAHQTWGCRGFLEYLEKLQSVVEFWSLCTFRKSLSLGTEQKLLN